MFKQRRVPAKARRKTYAWSGDGVGADYDEDEPEERPVSYTHLTLPTKA